jgi:predicted unusual protein kinase regulating ubiquinone biosynthesis (AarF/ABC1/UbiB family)/nucleotide-binding universal stress UspA family protein
LVATDRSDTATRAVEWAAEMADRYSAELLVLQVVPPEHMLGASPSVSDASAELTQLAERVGGARGRARLEFDSQPAEAIVQVAAQEDADIVVVGNVSMTDRTEFLLGSVPNRVSHTAPCTVVIVDTRDGAPAAKAAGRHQDEASDDAGEGQLLGRAGRIVKVMAKYRLGTLLDKDDDPDGAMLARAQRLRAAMEELGPTFGKLGQILSTRPDLLPDAFASELSSLQDQVTPLSEAEVVAVMEQELRVPWEDVFLSIEPQPMAAGTIAQVHRAVLVGGERVVVKVQRPSAEHEILQDLGLLKQFAEKAAGRPAFTEVIDVPAIIDHLSTSLRRELDFRHEAANIERMRSVLEPFERLDVPDVHDELSTARLLVMQEVQGVAVMQAPEGEARRAAGREMLEAYYQQVLADGFFHADPHPGNLMWWNDKIYLLDLGMVGEVDDELRGSLLLLLLAFWQEDTAFLADLMLSLSDERPSSEFNEPAFREEIADLVSRYRHLPLNELRLGPLLQQLTELSLRHGVHLPAALALIGKAFGQMQLTAAELDPSLDPFSVAGAFFVRQLGSRLRSAINPQALFYEGQKLRVRVDRLLQSFERVVGARPGAGLQVQMPRNDELTGVIDHAGKRIALGLTAATAIAGTAVTASADHRSRWTTPTFGAAAAVLTSALLADVLRRR